jgi:hypothetical protein
LSARLGNKTAVQMPRTATGLAAFMLFPVLVVVAVSFPVAAAAAVGGAVVAKFHRRWRTARADSDTDAGATGLPRTPTHDV